MFFKVLKLFFRKFVMRQKTGVVIKDFCESMGVVYIKLAQILATQNFGNLFTEEDRILLSGICDEVNPVSFDYIREVIEAEYGQKLEDVFSFIDNKPLGSASISQVHKAILLSGEVVAVKVKRKDVALKIEKDIKTIRKLIHRFGKFFKFKNFIGGDKALDLYLEWINEEVNFEKEKNNLLIYRDFVLSVNGKLDDVKNINVPKVYLDMCTENIIVMEFISSKTINKIELNSCNTKMISEALNSYLASSFYALFHDMKIVFHGDPHGGNIYILDDGSIGFLDMGLIFELSEEDAKLIREFFFSAYSGNYEKLYEMLVKYSDMSEDEKSSFKEKIKNYVLVINAKPVTCYFTDMINICLGYNVSPPNFLFCMAKAFVCLDGISCFSNNNVNVVNLLQEQIMEYFVNRSMNDCKGIVKDSFFLAPKLLMNSLKYGFTKGVSKEINDVLALRSNLKKALEHYDEVIDVIKFTSD